MLRRTRTCGSPVVAETCSHVSCGTSAASSPSGSVSFAKMSAARRQIAISSRVENAASAARASACRSRSRRIRPSVRLADLDERLARPEVRRARASTLRYGSPRREDRRCAASIHSLDHALAESVRTAARCGRRPTGYCVARRLALGLVALQEARHEELPGQRRQAHAAGLAVVHAASWRRRDRRPRSSRAATAGSR